jgi:hypothetical protein
VAVGDFNADGQLDLATTRNGTSGVFVLLNAGPSGFTPAPGSPFPTGTSPFGVAVADFNADGKLDLVTANNGSNDLSVLLGNGAGGFSPAPGSPVAGGPSPLNVTVGDFNGDGTPDLATANLSSAGVTVLVGSGTGSFSVAAGIATGASPDSVAVGDFNLDGKLDLAVANSGNNNVTILLNTCTPLPTATATLTGTATTTRTSTATTTRTSTATITATGTATTTATGTATSTTTATATATTTSTATATSSATATVTPTRTSTATATATTTVTPTRTSTASSTTTATSSATTTRTTTATATATATVTPTRTSTATLTSVPTGTSPATATLTATSSATATSTASGTSTATLTGVPTGTATATVTSTATGTGTATLPPGATATAQPLPFTDVPVEYWAYGYIKWAYQQGIISGYADGTFRPDHPVTRGQVAKMIVLGAGWALTLPAGAPHFTDVPPGSTFYAYIEVAVGHGILGGYLDGTYRPALPVTRAQLTKLAVLARELPLVRPATPSFSDVPPDSWAYAYIETAAAHAIVGGYPDGTFRPGASATRAQFCKILNHTLAGPAFAPQP